MSNPEHGIQIQLKKMDHKKKQMMEIIRSLPEEIYRLQPDQYKWSVAQVANHLYLSEMLSLAYLKKKLSYPEMVPPFSFKSWWALFFVSFTLWTPVKVKAPPKINMWGDQEVLSPDELDQRWNQVRNDMTAIIMDNLPRFRNHLVYNHPYAGRMTMRQMLVFMNHHIAHHLRQARRIISNIG